MSFSKNDTTVAKGIAIILMCIHHLFAFPNRFPEGLHYIPISSSFDIEYILGVFGKLCVTIFIVLSGYGSYLSMANAESDCETIVKNKLHRLYIKYWSVFIIYIPIGISLGISRIKTDPFSFICNFFAINTTYNGEWWFITPFILLTIFSPILVKIASSIPGGVFCELFYILLIGTITQTIMPKFYDCTLLDTFFDSLLGMKLQQMFSFIPAFLMGCFIAKNRLFDKYLAIFSTAVASIPISSIIILFTLHIRHQQGSSYDYIIAPFFIICTTAIIKRFSVIQKLLILLGNVSTEIWFVHSFYCYHFIPRVIFAPKYSILITIWLIFLSYISGAMIVKTTDVVLSFCNIKRRPT